MRAIFLFAASIAIATIASAPTGACGPRETPKAMTADAERFPRAEMTVVDEGVLANVATGDVLYARLGIKQVDMPWAPEGQQKATSHALAFTVPFVDQYLATRPEDQGFILSTGATLEAAYAGMTQLQRENAANPLLPRSAKKPPGNAGEAVRSFPVKDGIVQIFTTADFNYGVLFDPATGKKVMELRIVKGG